MEKLGVNLSLLITQTLNFFILMGVLTFLLYKPILKNLEERKKKIEEGLRFTDQAKQEKEKVEEVKKRILKEAREEGQRIVKQAVSDAKAKNEELLEQGKKGLDEQRKKMIADLETEQKKMLEEVRTKTVDYAVAISEKILGEKMSSEAQKKLVAESLKMVKAF